jgi:hypothetical protein
MVHGEPAPPELIEWQIIFETGWTLEEVRNMSIGDLHAYFNIKDGMSKARSSVFVKKGKR